MSATSWSGDSDRIVKTVTIANNASLSSAVNIQNYRLAAIDMPAAWTAAVLTFQGSPTSSTYQNLYDDAGTEVTIPSAAATAAQNIVLGSTFALHLMAHNWLKIRSGTAGSAVNQGGERTLTLILFPA